jgi:hypothetical protein
MEIRFTNLYSRMLDLASNKQIQKAEAGLYESGDAMHSITVSLLHLFTGAN